MYFIDILTRYQVDSFFKSNAFNTFLPIIRDWAGPQLLSFDFSGSTAKGTDVNCSSDVDFFISLCSSTSQTLEQIYSSLFSKLDSYSDIRVRKQNVSIGVSWQGGQIDFTPGKKHVGNTNDHSLYRSSTGSWTLTNIQKHIDIVQGSQRVFEIKLFKIWRQIHQLEWPSIFLELFIIDALKGCPIQDFSGNCTKVLKNIFLTIEAKSIQDPSNSNNVISNDLSMDDKRKLRNQAYASLQSRSWSHVFW